MRNLLNVQIRDRVWDIKYGWGTVVMIWDDRLECVDVSFDNYYGSSYTIDGKKQNDKYPRMFFDIPTLYKKGEYPTKGE